MRQDLYKALAPSIPNAIKERRTDDETRRRRMQANRRALGRTLASLTKATPSDRAIQRCCDALVDYVSFSHYGVFWRINNGEERRQEAKRVGNALYPRLQSSTEQILRFTQHYQGSGVGNSTIRFGQDLARLGKHLKARFTLEDQLLKAMMSAKAEPARPTKVA